MQAIKVYSRYPHESFIFNERDNLSQWQTKHNYTIHTVSHAAQFIQGEKLHNTALTSTTTNYEMTNAQLSPT